LIRTSQVQLGELFRALKIPKAGTIMIHSSLFSLGLIEGGVEGFYKALKKHLGSEGTIIVPTFTYSFRREEVFDVKKTPSSNNIGALSEYIRNSENAIRSLDPMFSMAAIGPRSNELMKKTSTACFGSGSIYERLFDTNIIFVAIGITYSTGLTGFIHLEKIATVPYRSDLILQGRTRNLVGKEYDDFAVHYARHINNYSNLRTNREPIGLILESAGVSNSITYGYGKHMSLAGQPWLDFVLSELHKNPFVMLQTNHRNYK